MQKRPTKKPRWGRSWGLCKLLELVQAGHRLYRHPPKLVRMPCRAGTLLNTTWVLGTPEGRPLPELANTRLHPTFSAEALRWFLWSHWGTPRPRRCPQGVGPPLPGRSLALWGGFCGPMRPSDHIRTSLALLGDTVQEANRHMPGGWTRMEEIFSDPSRAGFEEHAAAAASRRD